MAKTIPKPVNGYVVVIPDWVSVPGPRINVTKARSAGQAVTYVLASKGKEYFKLQNGELSRYISINMGVFESRKSRAEDYAYQVPQDIDRMQSIRELKQGDLFTPKDRKYATEMEVAEFIGRCHKVDFSKMTPRVDTEAGKVVYEDPRFLYLERARRALDDLATSTRQ